jgi:hypothetical protein
MRSCSSCGKSLITGDIYFVTEAAAAANNYCLSDFRLLKGMGEILGIAP